MKTSLRVVSYVNVMLMGNFQKKKKNPMICYLPKSFVCVSFLVQVLYEIQMCCCHCLVFYVCSVTTLVSGRLKTLVEIFKN